MIQVSLSGTKDDVLLNLLVKAHQDAANNNPNASAELCVVATKGSGDFTKGVIAGLASTGGAHAPLREAREVYLHGPKENTKIIPGFGNSFYKDKIDPAFQPVMQHLVVKYRAHYNHLVYRMNEARRLTGKELFPNAAIITAAVCEVLQIPDGMESLIFMMARIPVWAEKSFAPTI